MNSDEDTDWKELVPRPLVDEIKQSKVCLYLGLSHGRKPEFEDFLGAMPLLGDCDALVVSEPCRSQLEVRKCVERYNGNYSIPIPGGFICKLILENTGILPGMNHRHVFREPPDTEWFPLEEKPDENRFWAERAWMVIEPCQGEMQIEPNRDENKTLPLIHIGIGGMAACLCFFQPNGITPSRIIGNPF